MRIEHFTSVCAKSSLLIPKKKIIRKEEKEIAIADGSRNGVYISCFYRRL